MKRKKTRTTTSTSFVNHALATRREAPPIRSNLARAKVAICGTRPLLQHRFAPEALALTKSEKAGVAGNNPEEWRLTRMVDENGQLYVPDTYVFAMMRDAAKYTRKGRGTLQPLVAATLQVVDERIRLDRRLPKQGDPPYDRTKPVYIDVSGVRNPSTKARNVRYRLATSSGWRAEFTLLWDKTVVSREQMHAVVNDAGSLVGLGSGRSVGYGRFVLERFELGQDDAEAPNVG